MRYNKNMNEIIHENKQAANIDTLETFLRLIKTSDERSLSTETEYKYLVELPMTAEEYAFFTNVLKKINFGTTASKK